MFFDADNSREAIKTRMLRLALNYWDTKNVDELDPVVKLLMEALSAELYDIVNDVRNAEGRILEKISHLLAPDLLTTPMPAHAVAQALPAEPFEVLTDDDQFYMEKKVATKTDGPLDKAVDIYFTPVQPTRIFDARLSYIFSGTSLFAFDQHFNKVLAFNAAQSSYTTESCFWIGVDISTKIKKVKGMSFFFELRNVDPSISGFFYQYLPYSRWFIGSSEISVKHGLHHAPANSDSRNNIINDDTLHSFTENIRSYYSNNFITITDDVYEVQENELVNFPAALAKSLPAQFIQEKSEKLLWLKILFPVNIQQELLNEVVIKVNAFPVMNCRKNELRYRLRAGRHIIPLPGNSYDRFLRIKSFTDGTTNYKPVPLKKTNEEDVGIYTLRTGGLERFDSRNGREMILYLIELLRSESAAFSAFGHDFIAGTLKEMNQFISLLEQKTNTTINDVAELSNYIIVKPAGEQELMFIEYWTTNIDVANNIRSGSKLQQAAGVAVRSESLMLLTPTIGGKDKLKSEEKLYAFKYGLLTRDRIVTMEDIRSFCYFELGKRVKEVSVKRGFIISDNPKEGMKRTIDVILALMDKNMPGKDEIDLLCAQLKSRLESKSGMSYNYRVKIKE